MSDITMENENKASTCIQFKITDTNKCKNCKVWEDTILIANPGKKRRSKCYRPWELEKGSKLERAKVSTL